MWDCYCDEYSTQDREDDCCPDWCESRRVKGRFGLAFVAETPCCCPEPIGWQVEFCDTPSKVEQRCKEMVQWANCPPLPRCEPCPPVEVCSPCFPPRCNPCCPLTNPCPPSCPPRCRPSPRPPSPRRRNRPENDCFCCPPPKLEHYCPPPRDCCCCPPPKDKVCFCCPPPTSKKCCCIKDKPKSRCCKCDMDNDMEEDDDCPCRKSSDRKDKKKPKVRPVKSRESEGERGDAVVKDKNKNVDQKSSFLEDEVPVKESKERKPPASTTTESKPPASTTTESKTYSVNTPAPYRTSNQRTFTPPRTGRNSTVESNTNNQNLSTSPQASNTKIESSPITTENHTYDEDMLEYETNFTTPVDNDMENVSLTNYHPSIIVSSHHSTISNNQTMQENWANNKQTLPEDNLADGSHIRPPNFEDGDRPEYLDTIGHQQENTVGFAQYQQAINFQSRQFPKIKEIRSNNYINLYNDSTKGKNKHPSDNFDVAKSFVSSSDTIFKRTRGSSDSRSIPGRRTSSSPERLSGSIKVSSTTHPRQSQLGKFTAVYSSMETNEAEEVVIVKRRRWLPYEFLKGVKKRFFGIFRNNNESDTDSNCSDNVPSEFCKKVVSNSKDIKNY